MRQKARERAWFEPQRAEPASPECSDAPGGRAFWGHSGASGGDPPGRYETVTFDTVGTDRWN